MIDPGIVEEFLAQRRVAVVGVSNESSNFGRTVYRELRDHGHEVVAVNPNVDPVDGDCCHPDLAAVPGMLDSVIVMVRQDDAVDVVRACVALGVPAGVAVQVIRRGRRSPTTPSSSAGSTASPLWPARAR